jgi:hypothetical protein
MLFLLVVRKIIFLDQGFFVSIVILVFKKQKGGMLR